MKKCSVKRRKAFAGGWEAAATLAAAGIGAAATYAASVRQADAARKAADKQAAALKAQNENANTLQERNIEFTRQENELNRQLQRDMQMNLQMLNAQQNSAAVADARRIQVKKGGIIDNVDSPFYGRAENMPFRVTDGGTVVPVMRTPEGYDLYEILGNDHEHYHKSQGGKHKTGVGIKFPNGETIEGEGNQNSSRGELLLVTPDSANFISKHSLDGFNPTKAVEQGMHPMEAFQYQEMIKSANGMNDSGYAKSSPVEKRKRKALLGTFTAQQPMMGITPDLGFDGTPMLTQAIADYNQPKSIDDTNLAKYGKRVKAANGLSRNPLNYRYPGINFGLTQPTIDYKPGSTPSYIGTGSNVTPNGGLGGNSSPKYSLGVDTKLNPSNTTNSTNGTKSGTSSTWDNYGGSIVNGVANVLGAGITAFGNYAAERHMSNAYRDVARTMGNAYRSLRGIDMSLLNRDDYKAAHAMAAVQAPIISTGAERTAAERALHRTNRAVQQNTLSSAAAQNRMNAANAAYQDQISQIEANANKLKQGIISENLGRITDVSKTNAMLDTEANSKFASSYLDLLKYNNDIENNKILGAADAESTGIMGVAQSKAQRHTANAQGFVSALTTSANTFNNNMNVNNVNRNNYAMTMMGATHDATYRTVMGNRRSNSVDAEQAYGLWSDYVNNDKNGKYSGRKDSLYEKYAPMWRKMDLIS